MAGEKTAMRRSGVPLIMSEKLRFRERRRRHV